MNKIKPQFDPSARPLQAFINQIQNSSMTFNYEYQREYVWKDKFKDDLILSIMFGMPIGMIIIWEKNNGEKEIVDGLQRLKTIIEFVSSDYKLSGENSAKIIEYYWDDLIVDKDEKAREIVYKVNANRGVRLSYKNMPSFMIDHFNSFLVSVTTIRYADVNVIRTYFEKVQNQESLKAGEIMYSMPENNILYLFPKEYLNNFAKKIGFNNERNDLLKFLTLMHGIYEDKTKLGFSDKMIIKYSKNIEIVNPVFTERIKRFFEMVIVSDLSDMKISTKSSLKLVLLYVLFGNAWKQIGAVETIKRINKLISDGKGIFKNNITQPEYDEIKKELGENIVAIQLLRGVHPRKDVKDAMIIIDYNVMNH